MRRTELDLCRITACLMVLLIHTSAEIYHNCPIDSAAFAPLMALSTMARGSVPVFFMLTGALFLSRETIDLRQFFKKHVLVLIGLYFLWSLLYALAVRFAAGSFGSVYDFFYDVAAGYYHMWFIPAMVLCYLFLPPLSCAIHGKKLDIRYPLFLFFFLGLFLANCNLTPDTALILNRLTLFFRLEFFPYLGYAVWGYWLSRREFSSRWLYIAPIIFVLCTAITTVGNLWYSGYKGEADGWLFSYFSLPSFIQASAIFCFFLALKGRRFRGEKLIRALSDCTLGVYLMHPLLINLLEQLGLSASLERPVISLLLFTLVLAVVCFTLTAIAKKIPGIRKLL